MNNVKCAFAVGAAYFLGRWHKLRWALALAGVAAGTRFSTNPRVLIGQLADAMPQVRELVEDVRGELAEAGKKAAVAAAGNRIGEVTQQLRQRTESLREDNKGEDEEEEEKPQPTRKTSRSSASSKSRSSASSKKTSGTTPRKRSSATASKTRPATRKTASSSSGRKTSGASARKSTSKSASTRKQE
ncbi:hypothetical protein [Catenulispora subtropica]|uniref:Uncharacterized protein n=1 Tax=Catenulispora subtropica TaxID=450798 RepID=A0ABN2RMR5_9ACTN